MYEKLRNPMFQQVKRINTDKAERFTIKDQEIDKAYNTIAYQIRLMLCNVNGKRKRQYLEYRNSAFAFEDHIVKEYVCAFCTVSLKQVTGLYRIVLTTGSDVLSGREIDYTKFLRIAFKLTMHENTNLCIEDRLKVELIDNQLGYFEDRIRNYDSQFELLSSEILLN